MAEIYKVKSTTTHTCSKITVCCKLCSCTYFDLN